MNGRFTKRNLRAVALGVPVGDIVNAINSNQVGPTKRDIKRMINENRWDDLGKIYHFTPLWIEPGMIDWRCVPKPLYEILQSQEYKKIRLPPAISSSRKMLSPKTSKGPGIREITYCEQSGECHYCGRHTKFSYWTIDHKTPLVRGGQNRANLIGACTTCNGAKGPLTYEEFMSSDYMGGDLQLKDLVRTVSARINGKLTPNERAT